MKRNVHIFIEMHEELHVCYKTQDLEIFNWDKFSLKFLIPKVHVPFPNLCEESLEFPEVSVLLDGLRTLLLQAIQ
jgi:hypothetical protein